MIASCRPDHSDRSLRREADSTTASNASTINATRASNSTSGDSKKASAVRSRNPVHPEIAAPTSAGLPKRALDPGLAELFLADHAQVQRTVVSQKFDMPSNEALEPSPYGLLLGLRSLSLGQLAQHMSRSRRLHPNVPGSTELRADIAAAIPLVRPDGHVAWRATDSDAQARDSLSSFLHTQWGRYYTETV
ncbi:hypothetical protein [Rhodococcus sp. KRD162]|uniref:aromatic-ring hydroxylase C-terminal domain-containing protein n=1 Tax=Rhodococcus sp. KRD162 TaxID=2729725 RepID=UPI0019D2BCDB|nr:hypothetical protein [Rhodococcus sp. KRD162]